MAGTRKIAAILVADIVGYSRLAGADEDRTLSRLRGLRSRFGACFGDLLTGLFGHGWKSSANEVRLPPYATSIGFPRDHVCGRRLSSFAIVSLESVASRPPWASRRLGLASGVRAAQSHGRAIGDGDAFLFPLARGLSRCLTKPLTQLNGK